VGLIRRDFRPRCHRPNVCENGAAFISVLTARQLFQWRRADLGAGLIAVRLPVSTKDFLIAKYQGLEAPSPGLTAFILIADPRRLPPARAYFYASEAGHGSGGSRFTSGTILTGVKLAPAVVLDHNSHLRPS